MWLSGLGRKLDGRRKSKYLSPAFKKSIRKSSTKISAFTISPIKPSQPFYYFKIPVVAVRALSNKGLIIMTMIFKNLDPGSTSEIRQSNNDVKLSNHSRVSKEYMRVLWGSLFEVISNPPTSMEHPCTSPRILLSPHLGHQGFLKDLDIT
jgi:hypothetical protein